MKKRKILINYWNIDVDTASAYKSALSTVTTLMVKNAAVYQLQENGCGLYQLPDAPLFLYAEPQQCGPSMKQ